MWWVGGVARTNNSNRHRSVKSRFATDSPFVQDGDATLSVRVGNLVTVEDNTEIGITTWLFGHVIVFGR